MLNEFCETSRCPIPQSRDALLAQRKETNPFELSAIIDRKLDRIERLRSPPLNSRLEHRAATLSPQRGPQLLEISHASR